LNNPQITQISADVLSGKKDLRLAADKHGRSAFTCGFRNIILLITSDEQSDNGSIL